MAPNSQEYVTQLRWKLIAGFDKKALIEVLRTKLKIGFYKISVSNFSKFENFKLFVKV